MVIAYKTRIDDEVLEGAEGILDNLLSLCSTQTVEKRETFIWILIGIFVQARTAKDKKFVELLLISCDIID